MNYLVSVIVPVYNSTSYLKRCVDAILSQTYENLEILLIDDGSTDDSFEICKEYEKKDLRVRAFHKENGGSSSARNVGIKEAKGDFICFCDSDDYYEKDIVEKATTIYSTKNKAHDNAINTNDPEEDDDVLDFLFGFDNEEKHAPPKTLSQILQDKKAEREREIFTSIVCIILGMLPSLFGILLVYVCLYKYLVLFILSYLYTQQYYTHNVCIRTLQQ